MWIFRVVLFDWGAGILVLVSPGGWLIQFQHDDRFATYEGSVTALRLVTLREADRRHELQSVCHWSVESLQQRPLNEDNARLKGNKNPSDFSFVAVVEYLPQNVAKKKRDTDAGASVSRLIITSINRVDQFTKRELHLLDEDGFATSMNDAIRSELS